MGAITVIIGVVLLALVLWWVLKEPRPYFP